MRFSLLSGCLCMISSITWSQTVFWTDLVENPRDGLVYQKFMSIPFTGFVTASADVPFEGLFKEGLKHGEWFHFDANGHVKSKSEFVDGSLRSKSKWQSEGGIFEERYEYFENGQMKSKSTWQDGKEYGEPEVYYQNGQACRRCGLSEN